MLRMLFVCCDDSIPSESRLVLALKTLCGFSTKEIALRLFMSEANVHKRLGRARERLRQGPLAVETPPLAALRSRLSDVHAVLYLLFNEGYLAAHAEQAIRRELCDEAVRLATLLAEHPVGAAPESFALLALMHFHLARLGARVDAAGGLLLLEEQDRSLWDREGIRLGAEWLAAIGAGRGVLPVPCGGWDCRRALLRALVPGDALARDRRALRDARAHRPLTLAHAEPCGGRRRMAGARRPALPSSTGLHRPRGSPAPTSGTPSQPICTGAPGMWRPAGSHRERALSSAPTDAVRELLARRLVSDR